MQGHTDRIKMQTQTQVAGQAGQSVNGPVFASNTTMGGWRKTWHSDDDTVIRRELILHILNFFSKPVLENKFLEVKRLEEALYREAVSKEEYIDVSTLERRICTLMLRLKNNQNLNQHRTQMASSFAMNPANSSPGCASKMALNSGCNAMIPTPGTGTVMSMPIGAGNIVSAGDAGSIVSMCNVSGITPTQSLGSNTFATANGQFPYLGICGSRLGQGGQRTPGQVITGTGSQMIPTPGLNAAGSSAGLAFQNTDGVAFNQLKQQKLPTVSGCQLTGVVNGQSDAAYSQIKGSTLGFMNLGMNNGIQAVGGRQILMNGNAPIPNSTGYFSSSPRNNVQMNLQSHIGQSLPHMQFHGTAPNLLAAVAGDGYAMNATDLTGSGRLYNPMLPTGFTAGNLGLDSLNSPSSKMVPVPGTLYQQKTSRWAQNIYGQPLHQLHQGPSEQTPTFPTIAQQQQPFAKGQIALNTSGLQEHAIEVQNGVPQHSFSSLPAQENMELLISEQHQSQLQQEQPSGLAEKTPREHHNQENQNLNCPQKNGHQEVEKRFLQSSKQQQQQSRQAFSDEHVEQNERTCQATSNSAVSNAIDTGQSEVASNGDKLAPGQATGAVSLTRAQQYQRQQRWLLFLRHASRCTAVEGQCPVPHCCVGRQLWMHLITCSERTCQYPRCSSSRALLFHHQNCREVICPVCTPIRNIVMQQRAQAVQVQVSQGQPTTSTPFVDSGKKETGGTPGSSSTLTMDETILPSAKRAKGEVPMCSVPQMPQQLQQPVIVGERQEQMCSQEISSVEQQAVDLSIKAQMEIHTPIKAEASKSGLSPVKTESDTGTLPRVELQVQGQAKVKFSSNIKLESKPRQESPVMQAKKETLKLRSKLGFMQVKQESIAIQAKQESVASASISNSDFSPTSAKPGKIKVPGISYIELFNAQQIREHISSLRQWTGQSKAKAEKNQAMEYHMTADVCPACAVEKLYFDSPPIYCTSCGGRIKKNAVYYTASAGETRHYFCIPCYNEIKSEIVQMDGFKYPKTILLKKRNDEQQEEAWVECDKCEKWQHQVCVLFNARINDSERAEYTCPECCMAEMERGERVPYSRNSVLGAKDLPQTLLSDHIEERLALRLEQERNDRAKALGKNPEEVPGADGLVVRVLSSVDKKLEVKQKFLELFQQEDYPTEYPYKSKMLMLFQNIEGVEVCLFGMYVQEFGAECSQPNHRRVYLSYLDSVKYFRPDVKTVEGEALRTFVYHEILVGYLDYCKRRGFSSCYIWACPPLKGEDYILYCHPEIQKTPKSDKLREWYLNMIAKAKKEQIVVSNKNLYDYFFTSLGESKVKVTAARLPYFDGDYWPGAAEDILMQLQQDEEEGRNSHKRGKTKKVVTKRSGKAAAQAELASNESRDLQLMQKLGQSIVAMKEDFIMVHLHHACSHCRVFILFGHRWVCQHCNGNFQLCSRCYEEEKNLEEEKRHPIGKKEWHPLIPVEVNDVPADTRDMDEIIESEFFDTRQSFLSLCQGNHYQYDTLRRAKHSSMMALYHLHNPSAPAFTTSCNVCHREIEVGQGWKCETCSDFDVCNACYSSEEVQRHPHKLVPHPSAADRNAQNKEARQQRLLQLRKMLELLVHASKCPQSSCQYAKCRNMKELFRHGMNCRIRAQGGCNYCRRMWYLLQAHARSCKETRCHVPRCMDLREHSRRSQLQQESRRRAAVNEMMRQRAAEAAAGSG